MRGVAIDIGKHPISCQDDDNYHDNEGSNSGIDDDDDDDDDDDYDEQPDVHLWIGGIVLSSSLLTNQIANITVNTHGNRNSNCNK